MSTKSVTIEEANAFMSSDNWTSAVCGRCGASLERGGGYRESAGDDSRRSLTDLNALPRRMTDTSCDPPVDFDVAPDDLEVVFSLTTPSR